MAEINGKTNRGSVGFYFISIIINYYRFFVIQIEFRAVSFSSSLFLLMQPRVGHGYPICLRTARFADDHQMAAHTFFLFSFLPLVVIDFLYLRVKIGD